MRNLKKFLALVLAMMMALSLMVTVQAKDVVSEFPDTDQIIDEFYEDVTVLAGMKVIQGHADTGTFAPKAPVTRAQMAAIVYRLATGDASDARTHVYSDYQKFSDVTADKWYAGYVGYCADAGYIEGYPDGTFKPDAKVTGYAALAMILRAMGYNEPGHNFVGSTWKAEVGSTATQRGMLVNINKSVYANTLNYAAPRELVAEIAFQGATKAMVEYTNAFGYQTTSYTGAQIGGEQRVTNASLGWLYYGLTDDTGIIVGNQETGEKNTRVSFSEIGADVYSYVTAMIDGTNWKSWVAQSDPKNNLPEINTIVTFDAKTGLDLFAHKATVWFDGRGSYQSTASVQNNNNLHTYAVFDRATLVSAVKHPGLTALTVNTPATATSLAAKAAGKGFAVSGGTSVYLNKSFERFIFNETGNGKITDVDTNCATTADTNKDCVFLLISNSTSKSLDVVIAMNIESARVTGVDNVNTIKTVTVPRKTGATDFIVDANKLGNSDGWVLEQNQLVPGSTKDLGQKEIGVNITGTATKGGTPALPTGAIAASIGTAGYVPGRTSGTYEDAWFLLKAVTEKVEGKVVAYNTNNGKITLDNGTVLDQSVLYDTVVGTGTTNAYIPQQSSYSNMTYEFYLDPVGKYLGAAPVRDLSFVYGTYMDYSQEVNTSAFKYFLTGVNLNGEKVTVPVVTKTWNPTTPGATDANTRYGADIGGTDCLDVPFRDTYGANGAINGIGEGVYKGWVINGTNASDLTAAYANFGITRGSDTIFNNAAVLANANPDGVATGLGDIFIGRTASTLGAVKAGEVSGTDLYFTENTKFIVVSGYGTDSLTVDTYDGISALRGSNTYVTLNMQLSAGDSGVMKSIKDATHMSEMTYYTISPFVYAQTGKTDLQAEVVIIPAAAIDESGVNSLHYVGNKAWTLKNASGYPATKFTMWQSGQEKSVWIYGDVTDSTAGNSWTGIGTGTDAYIVNQNHDTFYNLVSTGLKASDGEEIYFLYSSDGSTFPVTTGNVVLAKGNYTSATYSAQTGTFAVGTPAMRNVADAKVTNVNLKNSTVTWPGINDLTTLNQAGSLKNQGYGGADALKVAAVLNPNNPLIVDYIYVCYDQT